jgi:lipopolysaccharide biosynthesis glycosyltransferase
MLNSMADSFHDTVAATVAEVDQLFRTGKFKQSNELIDQLFEMVKPTSYMLFCRGRNLRYLGDLEGAATWLEQALQVQPTFQWAYYEMAAVGLYRGEFPAAGRHALAFISGLAPDAAASLNAIHKDVLLKSAHASFARDRVGTAQLYERLLAANVRDYLAELRLAEAMADRGEAQEAHARLLELDAKQGLDPWGGLIWVRVLRMLGRLDEARDKALQVLKKSAPEAVVRVHACQRLLDLGCVDLVTPYITDMKKLLVGHPGHPARDLRFRYACLAGAQDLLTLRDELLAEPEQLRHLQDSSLVDAIFALTKYHGTADPVKREVAQIVVRHMQDTRSYSSAIVLAMLHHYQFLGQYQDASNLLASITDAAVLAHPDIALRRFEILCRTDRLDEALVMYQTEISKRRLSGWESAFVLRFLAEMAMDDAAIDLLETILVTGQDLPRDDYLMLQIIRRAGEHQRIFAALHERMRTEVTADLTEFRRLLIDDLCLKRGADRFTAFGAEWEASSANRMLTLTPRIEHREPATTCTFLCTNRTYFFSALTFFMSCAANSPRSIAGIDWFVFLDDNVPQAWEAALRQVAQTAQLEVVIVREADFIPSDVNHMEAYGIFTGGVKLSRAAYFRIYAAVYLYGLKRYQLACYFDTDIICRGELAPMLQPEFGEHLVLARLEDVNDDVIAASVRSGADPYRYFNSGVLALNFQSSAVVEHLQEAIWLSEREPERLTFHDQCALNIAFKGRAGILDSRLNPFLRPNTPDELDGIDEAIMLHFLDRPKPWDIAFRLQTRRYWEPHAREVRSVVDQDLFRAIVAAANGMTLETKE